MRQNALHWLKIPLTGTLGFATRTLLGVHLPRTSADESFVNFDFALKQSAAFRIANRMRCNMNHAVFWVTPSARCNWQELVPSFNWTRATLPEATFPNQSENLQRSCRPWPKIFASDVAF